MSAEDQRTGARLWFRRAAALGAAATAVLALSGLLGYLPGLRIMGRLRSDYVPMAISTACCFLFLAAALFLHSRKPRRGCGLLLAVAPVIVVTVFGLLNVAGSIAGKDLNFEDRLFPSADVAGKIHAGHMSPASGAVFILAGLGAFLLLLASGSPRHARRLAPWAASLGILTMLAGATVVLSYLYGVPLMYSGSAVPMAATTAVAFLLLGTAVVAAAGPESYPTLWVLGDSTSARLSRVFLPLTMATVLLQGILSRFVTATSRINRALFLAALVIAAGAITAALVVRVAHAIGNRLDEVNRKLRLSEAHAQALLRTIPDMLFRIDRQGVFLDYKADSKDLYVQSGPTLIGQRLRDIVPAAFADLIDRKTRDTLETGALQTFEYRLPVPGLGERDYEARMAPSGAGEVTAIVRDITERLHAEEALKKSENEFHLLAESMPQIVWITRPDGWNIYFNRQWMAYTGLTLEESYGHGWNKPFHPDDQQRAWDAWQNAVKRNSTYSLECRLRRFDGVYKWWLIRGVPVLGEDGAISKWFGTCTDIDDMKKSELALSESEEKYRTLIEKANEAILIVQDGVFVFANRRMSDFLGVPAGELEGKPFIDFVWPEDRELVAANYSKRIAGMTVLDAYDFRIVGPKGRLTWVYLSAATIQWQGKQATLNLLTDISERKRAEDEIQRQLAEKEILLKEVHHRIKNNIASIAGLISLRLQSIRNPEAASVLKEAAGRIDSMRLLYDKLLLSEGYQDIAVKGYVESLAAAVVSLFPDRARITLDLRIADFTLDPKRLFPLGIIINELLTNKMKYAFIGKEAGSITVSLKKADGRVTLAVEDDGNRLPEGFAVNETKGFGLMLVRMLSQQLGGSFSMANEAGTRCTVEFKA